MNQLNFLTFEEILVVFLHKLNLFLTVTSIKLNLFIIMIFSSSSSSSQGTFVSMAVCSDGSYGIEKGLIYSFPVATKADHSYQIVQGLSIDDFARSKMDATMAELIEERDTALSVCA